MRIVERLLWIIVALSVALKLLHLPLASFLLIISVSSIAMMYCVLGWLIFPFPTRKDQHIGITLLASFGLNFLCVALLFKVQVWPMSGFQSLIGICLGSLAILLAWLHAHHRPERNVYMRNILVRVAPLLIVVALLYPISARSMILFHHRGESTQRLELWGRMYSTDDHAEKERIWLQLDSLDAADHRARLAP
jgi:hypothetical protein